MNVVLGSSIAEALRGDQVERYARHVLLAEVGARGQARLLAGAARVIGEDLAAEEAAVYLAAAGVGTLGLDQALAETIGTHLGAMNPDVEVVRGEGPGFAASRGALREEPLLVVPDGTTRLAGALAALETVIVMTGMRDYKRWEHGA